MQVVLLVVNKKLNMKARLKHIIQIKYEHQWNEIEFREQKGRNDIYLAAYLIEQGLTAEDIQPVASYLRAGLERAEGASYKNL